jgi:hypothetical protein
VSIMSSNSSSEPSCCLGYARNDRETKTPGGQVNGKKDHKSPEEKGREGNVTGLRKERNLLNYGLFSAPNCTSCRVMFGELLLPEAVGGPAVQRIKRVSLLTLPLLRLVTDCLARRPWAQSVDQWISEM